ncbi:MAG TPA: LacI family DNA-binding transcriptional regulator [Opitutaceae bacterium]|nr:LacI family DNA-binding transcriptional regulator [Opitutaceae bacterium]
MSLSSSGISLHAVASKCSVSAMTVSRVLRNQSCVSPETRKRVLKAAKKMGYAPDPYMNRLMARVRSNRHRRAEAVIAVVRDNHQGDDLLDAAYHYAPLKDIDVHASRYGYRAEEFCLDRAKMSPTRLRQILEARGIEGVIISPQSSQSVGREMDYAGLAAVTLGYGLTEPSLHRASTNMTRGILQATRELAARGYRRIGLAVTEWIDARSDHTYTGAMLNYQRQIPPRDRVPLLLFPKNNIAKEEHIFRAWFRRYRPDVILSFERYVPEWLCSGLGLRIPETIGLVVHDWDLRCTGFAGIDHQRSHVVAAAVDMLAAQLLHNERGVPAVARQVLIEPSWVAGSSIRPR